MGLRLWLLVLVVGTGVPLNAQKTDESSSAGKQSQSASSPRYSQEESSSKDTKVDISPPKDDAKNHPNSQSAIEEPEGTPPSNDGIQEFKPWNPMKAMKAVEVGDFYFQRKNYRAALDRYKEALYYKDNDAVATYKLAHCQEKLGNADEARTLYEAYLRLLPEGPFALDAQKALDRLNGAPKKQASKKE